MAGITTQACAALGPAPCCSCQQAGTITRRPRLILMQYPRQNISSIGSDCVTEGTCASKGAAAPEIWVWICPPGQGSIGLCQGDAVRGLRGGEGGTSPALLPD